MSGQFSAFFRFLPRKIWTAATPHDFSFSPQCFAAGLSCAPRCVCAVCGAEAARASELATIEIHPSILPREDQREGSVSVDGWEIRDVSPSCSSLI